LLTWPNFTIFEPAVDTQFTFFLYSSWHKIDEDVKTPPVIYIRNEGGSGETIGAKAIRIDRVRGFSTIGEIGNIGNI
jgi:hypothetical protein